MKKKILSLVLGLALVCGLMTACGSEKIEFSEAPEKVAIDEVVEETVVETIAESETVAESVEASAEVNEDLDEQDAALVQYMAGVLTSEKADYCLADLDQDGRKEAILIEKTEGGEVTPCKVYKVSEDGASVEECAFESNCYMYDICGSEYLGAYLDEDFGTYEYLFKYEEEYEGKNLFYYYVISFKNGGLSEYAVCSQNPMGLYDFRFEAINDENFDIDAYLAEYFEGKTKADVPALTKGEF